MREPREELNRRKVLAGAGAVGALAVGASLVPRAEQQPAIAASTEPSLKPGQEGGYRLTEHVLRYYQTARV